MTEEHAHSLLGLNEGATNTEITAAYRRLMQTVHPDVCNGPEADRLAREATDARDILETRTRAPRTDAEPVRNEKALQKMVVFILARTERTTTIKILATEVLTATRHLPSAEWEPLRQRLTEPAFWRDGETQGWWTIHGDEISPARRRRPKDESGGLNEDPSATAKADPGVTEEWRTKQSSQILIAVATEWIAEVAAMMLMIVAINLMIVAIGLMIATGWIAVAAVSTRSTGNWLTVAGCAIIGLTALKISKWITREIEFPDDTFMDPHVLIPVIVGSCLLLWSILYGLLWVETALLQ